MLKMLQTILNLIKLHWSKILLILLGVIMWRTYVGKIRMEEKLKIKEIELVQLQKHIDSVVTNLDDFRKAALAKLAFLDAKIDTLNKKSQKILIETRPAVDTFRVGLPDSLKPKFDSIITNYETVIKLKDTEIHTYQEKDHLQTTLDSLSSHTIKEIQNQTRVLTEAFKEAMKAARPGFFKRVFNKAPDLILLGLILLK